MMKSEKNDNLIWKYIKREYEIDAVLVTEGTSTKVVKAKCKLTGKFVAIKLMRDIFDGEQICRNTLREL